MAAGITEAARIVAPRTLAPHPEGGWHRQARVDAGLRDHLAKSRI
ncbi:hypothetical protein [Tabrizicola oligotrophica]|nr:hypothetical protein [Tabrizicola oligotrophica]